MSRNTSIIDVSLTDNRINTILSGASIPTFPESGASVRLHYQNEEQFIVLADPVTVPALPVHHGMDNPLPPDCYCDAILSIAKDVLALAPNLIAGTSWFFDPVNIHSPTFYRLVTIRDTTYLYLLLIDLTCRPLECEITAEGTNDRTSAYRTKRLYFECDWFPLEKADGKSLTIMQSIPFTWKGEAGQGYMVHGIWMDTDINKFFSKLILPAGKRNYPYYPITCKQHCITMNAYGQESPALLDSVREYIEPALGEILEDLQASAFSEQMTLFSRIKEQIPPELGDRWKNLSVGVALNEREQKEYTVEF